MGNFTDIEREFGNLVQKKFEDILKKIIPKNSKI